MTLASGRRPIFLLVVNHSAYLASSAVTLAGSVHTSSRDNVRMVGAVEEMVCVVYVSVTNWT